MRCSLSSLPSSSRSRQNKPQSLITDSCFDSCFDSGSDSATAACGHLLPRHFLSSDAAVFSPCCHHCDSGSGCGSGLDSGLSFLHHCDLHDCVDCLDLWSNEKESESGISSASRTS